MPLECHIVKSEVSSMWRDGLRVGDENSGKVSM